MILVTGATGNVGRALVQQLAAGNHRVRILVRDARKVAHLDAAIERVVGDLSAPASLAEAMRGVERVFLYTVDAQQVAHAVEAAKQAGVRQIVMLSTLEAGTPTVRIAHWHHERENLIASSGLGWTFLRPGAFMSNALQWAPTIKAQGVVYSTAGEGKSAPIDPQDIAAVGAVVLTTPGHEGKAYPMTGAELLTTPEQVAILSRVLGKPLRCIELTDEAAAEGMRKAGMAPVWVEALTEMWAYVRSGRIAEQNDTVEKVTGRKPRTFEDWCRDHAEAFR